MGKRKKAVKEPRVVEPSSFVALDSHIANQLRDVGSKRDLAALDIDDRTLYLTDAEVADVEAFKIRFKSYQAESEKRELARAFRILDLPPEVRVGIYEIVLQQEKEELKFGASDDFYKGKHILAFAITPKIARVCRSFRKECLSVFFATHDFVIPIATNLKQRAIHRTDGNFDGYYNVNADTKRSGVLNFKKPVKDAIRLVGNDAVFRRVEFLVYEAKGWTFSRFQRNYARHYLTCSIVFRRGQLDISITEGRFYPSTLKAADRVWGDQTESRDIDVVVEEIRRVVAELEAKENCKGLKLKDLEKIAKVCRFTESIQKPIKVVGEDAEGDDD